MESVLKEKQRKGQHAQHGKEQGSRLTDKHLSHSHSSQSVLRSFNIPDAGFGKRVNFQLNSRNFVSQIFLVCDMAVSDGGGYCKNLGLSLLNSVDLRYSGRKFHECDVETENFIQMHKNKEPEKLAELLRICGGANFATTKKVVVPLINYFSPLHRQKFEKGPCWYNTQGSSRLEVELKFRAKDDVCAGSGAIQGCEVYNEEVHVPLAVETSYRNRDKVRPRITYNSIKDITTSSGVRQEIDLSSIIAGGNVKCMWFRENLIADRTGSTRDDLNQCATVSQNRGPFFGILHTNLYTIQYTILLLVCTISCTILFTISYTLVFNRYTIPYTFVNAQIQSQVYFSPGIYNIFYSFWYFFSHISATDVYSLSLFLR
jgi:hypothetical protein